MKIPIYIPSYRRAQTALTPMTMHGLGFFDLTLCIRKSEKPVYDLMFPGTRKMVLPNDIGGLAGTRQYLLDRIKDDFYVVMDDDIRRFSKKLDPSAFGGLSTAGPSYVQRRFRGMAIQACSLGTMAGSIPDRYTVARPSKQRTAPYGFMRQCLFMTKSLRKLVRFDRLQVFLDIDFSLQCMKAGVPVRILRDICVESQPDAYSSTKGGLGAEREEMIARAGSQKAYDHRVWRAIHALHSDVITFDGDKHRISWRKAYEIGLNNGKA